MTFSGRWLTTFGPMILTQEGSGHVRGAYGATGTEHPLEGTTAGNQFSFRYSESNETGSGRFTLRRHGFITGDYVADGSERGLPWQGWRGCDGLWDTPLGRIRLIQDSAERVTGLAEYNAAASIEGHFTADQRLTFTLRSGSFAGDGVLTLDATGMMLSGDWTEHGQPSRPLVGHRVLPRPGMTWLVVIEAHWQHALDDNEYAFGNMLKELFARLPRVQVRHRFYHDETSLLHWCRQLLYLAEPAVLVLASHGEVGGLTVNGQIIPLRRIIENVQLADSIQLLHLSSCLAGQDGERALSAAPFPVSGYRTSVDWAQSALTEFIYLDMILEKGLSPAAAADQLLSLVRFAGEEEIAGSPYRPAGFCFFGAAVGV